MNKDEVVYPCYALLIEIKVEFICTLMRFKYPANIQNASLRTFVQCMLSLLLSNVLKIRAVAQAYKGGMANQTGDANTFQALNGLTSGL